MHAECLAMWVRVSGRKTCEICGAPIVTCWEDAFRVAGDMTAEIERYVVWCTIFTLACPAWVRTRVVVLQLIWCAHFREGDGYFFKCQAFTCQWRLILPAACLRLLCTALRRCSTASRG